MNYISAAPLVGTLLDTGPTIAATAAGTGRIFELGKVLDDAIAVWDNDPDHVSDDALDSTSELARTILACPPETIGDVAIQARALWWQCALDLRLAGTPVAGVRDDFIGFFRGIEAAAGQTSYWSTREPFSDELPPDER